MEGGTNFRGPPEGLRLFYGESTNMSDVLGLGKKKYLMG